MRLLSYLILMVDIILLLGMLTLKLMLIILFFATDRPEIIFPTASTIKNLVLFA